MSEVMKRTNQKNLSELGGAAATVIMFIPATVILVAVLLDLSGWFLFRDECQLRIDIAALTAARRLPDHSAAREVVDRLLADQSATTTVITATEVRIEVTWRYLPPVSARLLGSRRALAITLESEVEVVPRDYILIVADGQKLRPRLSQRNGSPAPESAWEEPSTELRTLDCLTAPLIQGVASSWWNRWSDPAVRRSLQQACANSVLTPLKQAALDTVAEATAFTINRLALLFTPGNGLEGASVSRPLLGLEKQFLDKEDVEAQWTETLAPDLSVSDEVCAMLYESSERAIHTCPVFTDLPRCGDPYRAWGLISECYREQHFTVQDAIRWHAIRDDGERPLWPDLLAALQLAEQQLTLAPDAAQLAELKQRRPTHWARHSPIIVVLTDTIPPPELLLPQLRGLMKRGASIGIVAFTHRGLSTDESAHLIERIHELQLATQDEARLKLDLLDSPEQLSRAVGEQLAELGRRYALKK